MLKKLTIGLAVVIALVCGFAATRPNTFKVSRTATIEATPAKILPLINNLKAATGWSPFEKDPNSKRTFSGPETGAGAFYKWEGNKEVGEGSLKITEATDSKIVMELDFIRPMEGHNIVTYELQPKGTVTEFTWTITGPMPFLSKVICLFMNMDKMIGGEFEKGLASLKALAEKK